MSVHRQRLLVIVGWLLLSLVLLIALRLTAPRAQGTATATSDTAPPVETAIPVTSPTSFVTPTPCPDELFDSPSQEIWEPCINGKATALAFNYDPALRATADALLPPEPTMTPIPTRDGPPLPTSTMDAQQAGIYEVETDGASEGAPGLKGVNSLWHAGSVPAPEFGFGYNDLAVYTKPKTAERPAVLGTLTIGNIHSTTEFQHYYRVWPLPLEAQAITITNVLGPVAGPSGPQGKVIFSMSSGQTGSFDFTTQLWSIGGQVLGTPVPTMTARPTDVVLTPEP